MDSVVFYFNYIVFCQICNGELREVGVFKGLAALSSGASCTITQYKSCLKGVLFILTLIDL